MYGKYIKINCFIKFKTLKNKLQICMQSELHRLQFKVIYAQRSPSASLRCCRPAVYFVVVRVRIRNDKNKK